MSWEPRHERQYKDGVLIRHRIQHTPDGPWEDYVPEEPPPVKKAHMKAFPTLADNGHLQNQDGMDLRDYFAAKAMTGGMWMATSDGSNTYDRDARECYKIADAMMKAREET